MNVIVSMLLVLGCAASESNFEAIFSKLGDVKSISASFTQVQHMKEFKEPLKSQGLFFFQAPKMLRWETKSPNSSILVINGSQMSVLYPDLNHVELTELSEDAISGTISRRMTALLSGNFKSLNKSYTMKKVSENGISNKVILRPTGTFESRLIRSITMVIVDNYVEAIEINKTDGGTTKIRFDNMVINPELNGNLFSIQK